ncbi:CAP domain-containing protein [Pseudonocardia sp. CA-107938]|uniref:CAP domain-containing protein n=1 Tax=Pseudonocardia sp. CA-107938 TaxID=3240021 RepID=UPI003D8D4FF5
MHFSRSPNVAALAAVAATTLLLPGRAQAAPACPDADMPLHGYSWFLREHPGNGLGAMFALADEQARASRAVACLVDAERHANGLPPLKRLEGVDTSAYIYARAAAGRKWWTDKADKHADPRDPRETSVQIHDRISRQHPCTTYVGDGHQLLADAENVYDGWGDPEAGGPEKSTPAGAFAWWKKSPPHEAAILDGRWTHTSVGVVAGTADPAAGDADPSGVYVQHFMACS